MIEADSGDEIDGEVMERGIHRRERHGCDYTEELQGRVGTLQGLLCRYEEREERLRRALNSLRDMLRQARGSSDSVSLTSIEEMITQVSEGLDRLESGDTEVARERTLERLAGEVGCA